MKNHINDKPLTTTPDNEKKKTTTEKMREERTDNDDSKCVEGEDQKTKVMSAHVGQRERVCRMC